jgi:hypothetical protein
MTAISAWIPSLGGTKCLHTDPPNLGSYHG